MWIAIAGYLDVSLYRWISYMSHGNQKKKKMYRKHERTMEIPVMFWYIIIQVFTSKSVIRGYPKIALAVRLSECTLGGFSVKNFFKYCTIFGNLLWHKTSTSFIQDIIYWEIRWEQEFFRWKAWKSPVLLRGSKFHCSHLGKNSGALVVVHRGCRHR